MLPSTTGQLRDALLSSLSSVPGTREFHIHVLVSPPRKHTGLFPFATQPRPRVYLQDILVLLSEQRTPDAPRVLVSGVEASLYHVPSSSCAVLHVSKVDSSGQALRPSPTRTVVTALLRYYADPRTRPVPATHLWIQLFARAQGQYLFPNSAGYAEKRPLGDVKLCGWWKGVLGDVVSALREVKTRMYYVLPGLTEGEAVNLIRGDSDLWTYGHPYSQNEIPLPCAQMQRGAHYNLGDFIPSFDDDPKSRFIDEIAYVTDKEGIRSPARKRPRVTLTDEAGTGGRADAGGETIKDEERPLGELGKVSADEFWERMSFRQECVAGAVTGFFAVGISSERSGRSEMSPLAPQPGQVSSQMNKRILSSLLTGVEFSSVDRAIRGTETLEGAIKGLCEGLAGPRARRRSSVPPRTPSPRGRRAEESSPNPFPEPVASLETYRSHIYGSVCVRNAASSGERADTASHVRVLAVRKKRRPRVVMTLD